MKSFTREEIAELICAGRCIIIANDYVYDATDYLNRHPGGRFVLESKKGTVVDHHYAMHKPSAKELWEDYKIGKLAKQPTNCCIII